MMIKILASPAFRTRLKNPHQALLYEAMGASGAKVYEFGRLKLFYRSYDIFHIHWPDGLMSYASRGRVLLECFLLFAGITVHRARGGRVVWTVHNLESHERRYPGIERWFWGRFSKVLDGAVFLSETSREEALKKHIWLQGKQDFVIPRGHYRGAYSDRVTRDEARVALGVPPNSEVVLFFGLLRRYKQVELLMDCFKQMPNAGTCLIVAGTNKHDAEYRKMLKDKCEGVSNIFFFDEFIPDERMQYFMHASDLAVFPYRANQNSGAALLALSFNLPVMLPPWGSNVEFQREFGEKWVVLSNRFERADIQKALQVTKARAGKELSMPQRDWKAIGKKTVESFKQLLDGTK